MGLFVMRKVGIIGSFALAAIGALALAGHAVPAAAQRPALAMLDRLEPGLWELRLREVGGGVERVCLRDGRRLIQLRHPAAACERIVLDDTAGEVAVQYTCRGQGYGLTRIRYETPRLIQLDSQGVASGLPFAFAAEGRRVGNCAF